jgi:phenylacetic acid degradation operon negative regulatory protein
MSKSIKLRITEGMLQAVWEAFSNFGEHSEYIQKKYDCSNQYYRNSISRLKKRGLIKVYSKQGVKFLELTKKGELKVLLDLADLEKPAVWDGRWRLIIFDIPEDAKPQRDRLRKLLKQHEFRKLQASVYISPYPLNRQALDYLKKTGLIGYIRILRVDDMDFDLDLKKKFKLS